MAFIILKDKHKIPQKLEITVFMTKYFLKYIIFKKYLYKVNNDYLKGNGILFLKPIHKIYFITKFTFNILYFKIHS